MVIFFLFLYLIFYIAIAEINFENKEKEKEFSDKDFAILLKKKLDNIPILNKASSSQGKEEHGVWQVLIGKQFAASVTFDARYIYYFQIEETRKYFLVFRS